ncbi:MAG: HNH endonuclease signature motif containing protein [bacterium]|nr:HNH endonuclease signature motif containing protein [bacterium]
MRDLSWAQLVRRVHQRAGFLCEYCHTSQQVTGQAMHVDHIDPDGEDTLDNLCLACGNCNLSKAQATVAEDPETYQSVPLFNPRTQVWAEHFEWFPDGTRLKGIMPTGRATIERLKINQDRIVDARAIWVFVGLHPPK